jgi:class 3 adenylate cyclase
MPVLSFRTKLLLAMTLVVTGVSLTILVFTQRRLQENYERNLRRQFDQQIAYFQALQETRLENIKQQCLNLSQLVRLIAALRESSDPDTVYHIAGDDLKRLIGSMRDEARRARAPGAALPPPTVFSFLDSHGRTIQPSEKVRQQLGSFFPRRRLGEKLAGIHNALERPERQQMGYLDPASEPAARLKMAMDRAAPPPDESSRPLVQQFILTKILDDAFDGALVGGIILGFPVPDLVPKPGTNFNAASPLIQSGILLQDALYSSSSPLSEADVAGVVREIKTRIDASRPKGDFEAQIANTPYRVFYQWLNPGSAFPPAYQVCFYSLEEARQDQRELRWKILSSGAIALVGALILSLLLSHGFAIPIRQLAAGTGEIRRGNFHVQVPVRTRDELGQLAASFNEMAAGLALKEKYRTALNMVADEKVAHKLVAGEIKLGGELREVSVLFCDIRGFTALTKTMPPGEVIEMLNEHMTALTGVVKAHHGLVDKFVGDLLMALFGAPVSHGQDALDAARCALELQAERDKLNQSSRHKLSVGIGLATGQVLAGGMGSADRLNYTVLGGRVNFGSRLCSHAAAGEILIDETTAKLLPESALLEAVSLTSLKGFDGVVAAYRLISLPAPGSPSAGLPRPESVEAPTSKSA